MNVTLIKQWKDITQTTLSELTSQSDKTILYFYPKDNTPGCITEAKDFSDLVDKFIALWIQIVGVSKDSDKSHCNFYEKQDLKIDLISDSDLTLHNKYWTWGEKRNYGRTYQWVIRSTFLLDKKWDILQERRNVRAKWHAVRILKEVKNIG